MERGAVAVVCVVLAAGASRRFGRNKLLEPLEGGTLLTRTLQACAGFRTVAVCSPQTAAIARTAGAVVVLNERPELGMLHSLRLAGDCIEDDVSIAVLPADLALVNASGVEAVIAQSAGFDVTFPQRSDGLRGHPVIFSPRARSLLGGLSESAPIRTLRDLPGLTRSIVPVEDPWPFADVDRESDLPSL